MTWSLGVRQSGYFAWKARPACRRQHEDMVLLAHVRSAFALSNGTYGSPRMTRELRDHDLFVGRRRTARLREWSDACLLGVRRERAYGGLPAVRRLVRISPQDHRLMLAFQWATEALVAHYFPDLGPDDQVVEPTCGPGAFLGVFPLDVSAIGIELDLMLAAQAREASGRIVRVGPCCRHSRKAPAFIGNPPFDMDLIAALPGRAHEAMADGAAPAERDALLAREDPPSGAAASAPGGASSLRSGRMTRSVRTLISTACVIVGLLAVVAGGDSDPAHLSKVEALGLLCIAVAFARAFMPAPQDDL
jgi:hypothetical protein